MTKHVSIFSSILIFILAFILMELGVSGSAQVMTKDAYLKRWPLSEPARHNAFGSGDRLFVFSQWDDAEHGLLQFLSELYGPDNFPEVPQSIINRLNSEKTLCIFIVRDAAHRNGVQMRGFQWTSDSGKLELEVRVTDSPAPLIRVVRAYLLKDLNEPKVNNIRELSLFSTPQQTQLITVDPGDPTVSTEGIVLDLPDTP